MNLDNRTLSSEEVAAAELETRRKYSGELAGSYDAVTVSRRPPKESVDYFDVLARVRVRWVLEFARSAIALDVGCATGIQLVDLSENVERGVGIDFSFPLIQKAVENASCVGNVVFCQANARKLPFRTESIDFVYSFSSLYHMPNVHEVVKELSRVLKSNGHCLLEMGNLRSLNTLVAVQYPELARSFHVKVSEMFRMLEESGLHIVRHRAFQILPLWGDRPGWLRPLLAKIWVRILQKQVGGRMLDEWISGLPGLNRLAFRHLFICRKL